MKPLAGSLTRSAVTLLIASCCAGAAEVGSAPISRNSLDGFSGVVSIYTGARIPAGDTVPTFSWFRDNSGSTRKITPMLFEETAPGLFRVRAIGTTRDTAPSPAVQSAPFETIAGSNLTNGPNFTFGFITAAVSASGEVSGATPGAAEYSSTVTPGEGSSGEGSTNNWVFAFQGITTIIVDSTTFGRIGATYQTNDSSQGGPFVDRTYSASVTTLLPPPPCGGADFNGDRVVNTPDLTFFLGRFGQTATPGSPAALADFNGSGTVDTPDLVFFLGRFGTTCN